MDEITTTRPQNAVVKYYKPSELLGMFTSYLSQQDVNRQVIYLQGIYLKNPKHDPHWTSRYDILRDENTQTEITLQKRSNFLKFYLKMATIFGDCSDHCYHRISSSFNSQIVYWK